jgi:acetoin utilization deacetylase AcuC-like enzyme
MAAGSAWCALKQVSTVHPELRVVSSERHKLHDPIHDVDGGVAVPQVEVPARAEQILSALGADDSFVLGEPTEHGLGPIEAVHAPGLIEFLRSASPGAEWFPDTFLHPGLREGMESMLREPAASIGRLGYWCFDTGTPIVAGTYEAARSSVDVALTAADLVLSGETVAYGLCRPPGHHAAHGVYGGFCFFNNAAIAAEYLLQRGADRIAVLDLDYHHGNGTQQIFYRRSEVLYASLHADPAQAFPFFTGYASETGSGPGGGATLNVPLPAATTNESYLEALDAVLEVLVRFAPAITVVSLGLDTYARDPLGDFNLTTPVYKDCGRRVAEAARKLVVLQEGGYYLPDLGENVRQWLLGAMGSP